MRNLITCLLMVVISGLSQGLNAQITEKAEFGKFAITGADLHTVSDGVIENGVLLIENNRISFVGKNAKIPADFTTIDASGMHVYPGFMDSGNSLGLVEISAVPVTVDNQEVGQFNPHVLAFTAFNPHSAAIPVTRVSGITHVVTSPSSGRFSGQASVMNLWGYSPDSMAIDATGALVVQWPTAVKGGWWDRRSDKEIREQYDKSIAGINDMLDKARFYDSMMSAYQNDPDGKEMPDKNIRLEALRPVVRGETPLMISVTREKDILNAIDWTEDQKNTDLRVIFRGVEEGWRVADEIAEAGIPCIVKALYLPVRDYDHIHRPYQNAGALHKAGVVVAMMSGDVENVRNLSFEAGYAAAYGLGTEEAVKAVTLNPAQIFGIDEHYGSLEAGKAANLFISSGDPFEPVSQIREVFINGYRIPLESRHTQLFKEFLNRDEVK